MRCATASKPERKTKVRLAFAINQIALGQSYPAGGLPRRRALARLSHDILETLAVGRLARQRRYLLRLHSAVWAPDPI
jgi:hypothetical protein